jgi:hypothetical protein
MMNNKGKSEIIWHMKRFENWNLPDLMHEVADWIGSNEINVSDVVYSTFDDNNNPVCSTVWQAMIYHVLEDIHV